MGYNYYNIGVFFLSPLAIYDYHSYYMYMGEERSHSYMYNDILE